MSNKFEYTYSAPTEDERTEIESIRSQYSPEERKQSDIERLRALNKAVNMPPKILSYILGIIGLLIFGTGLTMVLEWKIYIWGVVVMVIGVCLMIANHFIFKIWLTRRKKKYATEIIELSDRLLNKETGE